jgi:hypothetical protein
MMCITLADGDQYYVVVVFQKILFKFTLTNSFKPFGPCKFGEIQLRPTILLR